MKGWRGLQAVLFVNGEYGEYARYQPYLDAAGYVACADGGANTAFRWGIRADALLGDFDSVAAEVLAHYTAAGAEIHRYPPAKDETDLQITLRFLAEKGADSVVLFGSMGGRADMALSNLLSGLMFTAAGMELLYVDTACRIWLVNSALTVEGEPGDTVSLFALTPKCRGVTLEGFQYPLDHAELYLEKPYAVSNVLLGSSGRVVVEDGILAVMHLR